MPETTPRPSSATGYGMTGLPGAVIGAGPVGLSAAANLLEQGLTPIVFEQGPSVGIHHSLTGTGSGLAVSASTPDGPRAVDVDVLVPATGFRHGADALAHPETGVSIGSTTGAAHGRSGDPDH
jgi:lysine/ornithine N-monooxygenase